MTPKAEIVRFFLVFFKQRNEPAGFPSASAVDSGDTGVHKEGGVKKKKKKYSGEVHTDTWEIYSSMNSNKVFVLSYSASSGGGRYVEASASKLAQRRL